MGTGLRKGVEGLEPRRMFTVSPLADINPTPVVPNTPIGSSILIGSGAAELGGLRLFFADDGVNGTELWKSDGTPAGTTIVTDLNPGGGSGALAAHALNWGAVVFAGNLLFRGSNGVAEGLFRSDGTAAGTVAVTSGVAPMALKVVGSTLYFVDRNTATIWKSDGTSLGTQPVTVNASMPLGASDPYFTELGGRVYYRDVNGSLCYVDATGTHDLTSAAGYAVRCVSAFGGKLYFGTTDSSVATGFFSYAPAADSVQPVQAATTVRRIEIANGKMWLSTSTGAAVSDGTALGTVALGADVDFDVQWEIYGPGPDKLFDPRGAIVYFKSNDPVHGPELFQSDGTIVGTVRVSELPDTSSFEESMDSVPAVEQRDGQLYFFLRDAAGESRLWHSDGTLAGTGVVTSTPVGVTDGLNTPFSGFLGAPNAAGLWLAVHTADTGAEPYLLKPPTASAGGGYEGAGVVLLSASGSVSNIGGSLSYSWDLDDDAIFGESGGAATRGNETGATPMFDAGSSPITHTVSVIVTDEAGMKSAAASASVVVNPKPGVTLGSGGGYLLSGSPPSQTLTVTAGTVTFTANQPSLHVVVRSGANAMLGASQSDLRSVTVDLGGAAAMSGTGNVLVTDAVQADGKLDLQKNAMIVRAAPATRIATTASVTSQIKSGFNLAGTRWVGNGITTSFGGDAISGYGTLGVMLNDLATAGSGSGPLYTVFATQTVGVNDVLVRYTLFGDSDIDGSVSTNDYFQVDNGFLGSKTGWINGDFDYDGSVTTNDYFLIDNAFLSQPPAGPIASGPLAPRERRDDEPIESLAAGLFE